MLIAASMLIAGCHHNDTPKGVLGYNEMADFMAEVFTLEAFNNYVYQTDNDTLNPEVAKAYDEILATHNLTREQAEASMDYYSHHPEEYEKVLQIILTENLKDEKLEINF